MSTQTNIINEIKTKILQKFPALYIDVMESEYDGEVEFLINDKNVFDSKEFKELAWHLYVEYNNKLENGIAIILDESILSIQDNFVFNEVKLSLNINTITPSIEFYLNDGYFVDVDIVKELSLTQQSIVYQNNIYNTIINKKYKIEPHTKNENYIISHFVSTPAIKNDINIEPNLLAA